jgi:hypothetical protein
MSNLNWAGIWAWTTTNAQTAATLAGVLAGLAVVALLFRSFRRGGVVTLANLLAAPLVLGWEAEGMFEVVHEWMNLPTPIALVGAAMTSMVTVAIGARAHNHYTEHGTLGPNGRTVWYIALPVGGIVAAASESLPEAGMRIIVPVMGATLWWSAYRADEPTGKRKGGGSWVWTPRRIAVRFGWISPDPDDIITLAHDRGVRRLVRAQYALRYGWLTPRRWRERRVRRVSLDADDAMVQAAYEQMQRVEQVVKMTAPGYRPPAPEKATKSPERAAETPRPEMATPKTNPTRSKTGDTTAKKWVPAAVLVDEVRAYQDRNPGASVAQAARALNYDVRHVQKTVKAAEEQEQKDDLEDVLTAVFEPQGA